MNEATNPKVCVRCGAVHAQRPVDHTYEVACSERWGNITTSINVTFSHLDGTAFDDLALCPICERYVIRCGYEAMALMLPQHVWEHNMPYPPTDVPLFNQEDDDDTE